RPKGINQKNNHVSSWNWQAGRSSWRATGWATCTTVRSPMPTLARGSHAPTARLVTKPNKERSRRRHGISGRRAGFRRGDLRHGVSAHSERVRSQTEKVTEDHSLFGRTDD